MRSIMRLTFALGVALVALGAFVPSAGAHERRQIGQYVLVVGFQREPTYVEEPNGASITVFRTDGKPVEGVDKTLKVEIGTGGATRTLDLKPEPGKQGAYAAEFIPTKTGSYTFRFFGKIEDQDINERFESGPNRFDEVVNKADLQFPVKVPSNGELAGQLQSQPAGQSATAATGGASAVELQQARDRADQAKTRADRALVAGIGGLVLGLAGAALGIYGLTAGHRPASPREHHAGEPV